MSLTHLYIFVTCIYSFTAKHFVPRPVGADATEAAKPCLTFSLPLCRRSALWICKLHAYFHCFGIGQLQWAEHLATHLLYVDAIVINTVDENLDRTSRSVLCENLLFL